MNQLFFLALDLKDDESLIKEYEDYHVKVWPEIIESIRASGILDMQIYRTGNRMIMMIEASPEFSFETKRKMDLGNSKVQEWEELMWKFQLPLPHAKHGEKWVLMSQIFKLPHEVI